MSSKWTDQEIDAALHEKSDDLLPSSGFLNLVMTRVQGEATALPALPFPWRRALPGLTGTAIVLMVVLATATAGWTSTQMQPGNRLELQALSTALTHFFARSTVLWSFFSGYLASFCFAAIRRITGTR